MPYHHRKSASERLGDNDRIVGQCLYGDADDPEQRDRMIDWLHGKADEYETVLTELFGGAR